MSLPIVVNSTSTTDFTITPNVETSVMQNFFYDNVANGSVDVTNNHVSKTHTGHLRASQIDVNGMINADVDFGSLAPSGTGTFDVMISGMTSSPDDLSLTFKRWPN